MKNTSLSNWPEISAMENGDSSLTDIKRGKNTRGMMESTIVIYADKSNPLLDVVNSLVKCAVFYKQVSSMNEPIKLTAEVASYCANKFKKLNDKGSW